MPPTFRSNAEFVYFWRALTTKICQIALGLIEGIGPISAKRLVSYCGGAQAVFSESKSNLIRIPGIGPGIASVIRSNKVFERAEQELRFIEENGADHLFYTSANYSSRLLHCDDGPISLFVKGNVELNPDRIIAVVGTRKATREGRALCEDLIAGLSHTGATVISGLAYGIDKATHLACVDEGVSTIGVLAHGLDRIYPATHRALAERMLAKGGLVTEFASGTNPDRENFPMRNRIVAGMVDAVIVIESADKGGSLITAELALGYHRDVYAFPGRVGDRYSKGCNKLIQSNKAGLITSPEDVMKLLNWDINSKSPHKQLALYENLSSEEESLISVLRGAGKLALDEVTVKAELNLATASSTLLGLEFKGLVRALPGKIFELV